MAASLSTLVGVASTWSLSQWVFGLDVSTAATVAALAAGVIGTPMAAWAGSDSTSHMPTKSSLPQQGKEDGLTISQDHKRLGNVWNIPPRNPTFSGRNILLLELHDRLRDGGPVAVLALHGMGGVGKTSLTVEYAHRFSEEYDIAWWVNGEQADLISEQVAALGVAAGWVEPATEIALAAAEVLRRLYDLDRWLIIFDNVDSPDNVTAWLPRRSGHVLVTSRNPDWRQVAISQDVDVFSCRESVALLRDLAPSVPAGDAGRLAEALGHLPLALAQAGSVIAATKMTADDYVSELGSATERVMTEGRSPYYHTTLTATVRISLERLSRTEEAAVHLLQMASLLAPESVPAEVFITSRDVAKEPITPFTTSLFSARRMLGQISRYGLAKVDSVGLQIHRLTRGVIVGMLDDDGRARIRTQIERLVAATAPETAYDPTSWPRWASLVPHVLALEPARTENPDLRTVALNASSYLQIRGELEAGHRLAENLFQEWCSRLGPDHPDTLRAAHRLGTAMLRLGEYAQAKTLNEDTVRRQARVLGPLHPDTLNTANDIATSLRNLGFLEQARALHQKTLQQLHETLGKDDLLALGVAHNLAVDLQYLGLNEEALALNQDTYTRRRSRLGEDHLHTLLSAADLARDIGRSGRQAEALELNQETLKRRQRILGRDHPTTLTLADDTAAMLYETGRAQEAAALYRDTLSRRERVQGRDNPRTLQTSHSLATVLRALGHTDEAEMLGARSNRD